MEGTPAEEGRGQEEMEKDRSEEEEELCPEPVGREFQERSGSTECSALRNLRQRLRSVSFYTLTQEAERSLAVGVTVRLCVQWAAPRPQCTTQALTEQTVSGAICPLVSPLFCPGG